MGSDSRSARYGYTSLRLQTWTLLTDASEAELEMQINVLLLMLKKKKICKRRLSISESLKQ